MIWLTDSRGDSDPNGSWKTICMSLRKGRISRVGEAVDAFSNVGDRPFGGDEPQDREPERRLAGAGFADDAERLAGAQLERQAVDRLDVVDRAPQRAGLDREPDLQVVGLDHDGRAIVGHWCRSLGLGRQQVARIGVVRVGEDLLGASPPRRSCRAA